MHRRLHLLATRLSLGLLAFVACDGQPAVEVERQQGALAIYYVGGQIQAFGGRSGLCVAKAGGNLQTATCDGTPGMQFQIVGRTLHPQTDPSLCMNVQSLNVGGTPGIVNFATCDGSLNQKWDLVGGQIASANKSDGIRHCLDVFGGIEAPGTNLDLWTCNDGGAQAFWTDTVSLTFISSFVDAAGGNRPECLDLVNNNDNPGGTFQNADCALAFDLRKQRLTLDGGHHLLLSTNPGLALALTAVPSGGLAPVGLKTLTSGDLTQQWFFVPQVGNTLGGTVSLKNMSANVCLDVQNAIQSPGTPLVAFTCNNGAAQKWQPTLPAGGEFKPFGGRNSLCVERSGTSLLTAQCLGTADQQFDILDRAILSHSDPTLCLNVKSLNSGSTPGEINFATCDRSLNQQWNTVGGQIISRNRTGGVDRCLDVFGGIESAGTNLDLWPCNFGAGQAFWPQGAFLALVSSFTHQSPGGGLSHPECLELSNDNETSSGVFKNMECVYGPTTKQWFVLDDSHHILLGNNPGLALGLTGPVANGLAPVGLRVLNVNDQTQQWSFAPQAPGNAIGGIVSVKNSSANVCLDVQNANAAPGTPLDAFTCNGGSAQRWQPTLNGPLFLLRNNGPVLSAINIFQIYLGDWWQLTQLGQEKRNIYEDYVGHVADYVSGQGSPAGQVPYLRQYGVNSARAAAPTILMPDPVNLSRTQLFVSAGGITVASTGSPPATSLTVNNFTFDASFVGGTVTLFDAAVDNNNRAFVISGFVSAHVVTIVPTPFDRLPKDGNAASGEAQAETFLANRVQATISKNAILDDMAIQNAVTQARALGLVPSNDPNALVLVFPSVDFTPIKDGAYHNSVAPTGSFTRLAKGVNFERTGSPVSRMEGGISHEIFEAATNPFIGVPSTEGWIRGDGNEICDVCPNVLGPGTGFQFNSVGSPLGVDNAGVDMSLGIDNAAGGLCSSSGYEFP